MNYSNPAIENVISKISELLQNNSKPVLVVLDGRSGTGKTTIAKQIANRLNGVEILADNFWVGGSDEEWDKRSPQEKSEQAIDWKRIKTDVLEPLLAGKSASWHPFNWKTGEGLAEESIEAEPKKLVVLEGAYSSRPELQDIIDLSILVEVPDDANRRDRLINREGTEYMDNWHKRWDPAEDYYFSKVRPNSSFDMIIANH